MNLIIDNFIINEDPKKILEAIKRDCVKPIFRSIEREGDDVIANCPIHKNGQEAHPSFGVYARKDNPKVEFGACHCFTCGYKASLPKLVGDCLGGDVNFGKKWLVDHFGKDNHIDDYLEEIKLTPNIPKNKTLSSKLLEKYSYYHPYMWKRKLTKEVVDKFDVGYDKEKDMITFPVWDEHNNLKLITRRSVTGKTFLIDKDVDKPVYLLNFIINEGITNVMVTESQINCLYLWSLGYPAIALLGTGTKTQLDILKKCGIRHYTLCFDGDEAGDKGAYRFINSMPDSILISIKKLPRGKDCNDLSKDEFDELEIVDI